VNLREFKILGLTSVPLRFICLIFHYSVYSDNANSVRQAIKIMTKNELFQLGATRITVSTVAPTPDAFMEFYDSKCVLAWSVHAVSI